MMTTFSKRSMKSVLTLVGAGALAFGSSAALSTLAQSNNLQAFRQQALATHNGYRQRHSSPPLALDDGLNNLAQDWANHMAATGQFQHRPNNKFGENIAYYKGVQLDGKRPVQDWYNEISLYDYNRPGFSPKTGHFTQLVWRSTTRVGCGEAKARDGSMYVACNYAPFGNLQGHFPQNVLRNR